MKLKKVLNSRGQISYLYDNKSITDIEYNILKGGRDVVSSNKQKQSGGSLSIEPKKSKEYYKIIWKNLLDYILSSPGYIQEEKQRPSHKTSMKAIIVLDQSYSMKWDDTSDGVTRYKQVTDLFQYYCVELTKQFPEIKISVAAHNMYPVEILGQIFHDLPKEVTTNPDQVDDWLSTNLPYKGGGTSFTRIYESIIDEKFDLMIHITDGQISWDKNWQHMYTQLTEKMHTSIRIISQIPINVAPEMLEIGKKKW